MNAAIAELAQLDQWVISKYVERNGKLDKPPFSPATRRPCSHSNPAHWSSHEAALMALPGFKWLGFVFHDADPYSGIDVDGCAKPGIQQIRTRDDIEDWALLIIDQANSYTEISPSGKGVKIWVRGKLANTITHSLGTHKGIEVYSRQRYFTVTGRHLASTPTEIRDGQSVLDQLQRDYAPKVEPTAQITKPSIKTLEIRTAGRASLADVKAAFNAEHPLDQLLISYGAVQTSAKDFSCPFCEHTHDNTLFIYNDRVFSRSPHCKIPQKRGLDAFAMHVLVEHNNDVVAAAKKLNPIAPRQKRQEPPLVEPQIRIRTSEQIADANRKRAERCAAALATLADVQARASRDDELSKADRAVLDALIEIAGGRSWCRPSKDQIATVSTYSIGSVKRSLMTLEARGYFHSSGKGGPAGSNRTAVRTFVCGSFSSKMIHESIVKIDSIQTLEAYERAPEAQPRGAADTLDQWEACEPDFNPADLAWLYAQEWEPTPPAEPELPIDDPQKIRFSNIVEKAPVRQNATFDTLVKKEPDPAGGASYNPKLDHTAPRRRRAKQSPTERAAAAKARRQARWRDMDAPELRRNLIILSRKADKITHPAQRYALKEQCAEIEHYLALKDARLDAELALETAAPLPPPHKLAPEGRSLTLAMDFSQALAPAGEPPPPPNALGLIARLKLRDQHQAVSP